MLELKCNYKLKGSVNMGAHIISGSKLAQTLRKTLKEDVREWKEATNGTPKLVVVLVGDNPASLSYVRGKERACLEVGIDSEIIHLEKDTTEEDLLALIDTLNTDLTVNGSH